MTTFGDLIGLRLTIEIVHDRRHGELLRIKPTPPPGLPATSESELAGAEPDRPETQQDSSERIGHLCTSHCEMQRCPIIQ